MRVARTILKLLLVAGALAGAVSQAQQPISIATNAAPEFPTLRQDWWAEFEGAPEDVEPRIASLLEQVEGQIPDLAVQNQATASAVLQAVRDNFAVYVSLLGGVDIEKQALPEPAASYTIDELLDVAAQAREAQAAADDARIEVEREQRILDGASRRRDAIYKEYVAATDGDTRWLAALRVVRTRSAQAIAELRLDALTENADRADAHAANAVLAVYEGKTWKDLINRPNVMHIINRSECTRLRSLLLGVLAMTITVVGCSKSSEVALLPVQTRLPAQTLNRP